MKFTVTDLTDQKQRFNSAVTKITDQNNLHEIEQTLAGLEQIFADCEKHGGLQTDGPARVGRYSTTQKQIEEEMREKDQAILADARFLIARNSLRILQKTIPRLQQLCEQGLDIAGRDAVQAVCAPEQRQGTDFSGQPLSPVPSGFNLPAGFEPGGVLGKIKAVIGK